MIIELKLMEFHFLIAYLEFKWNFIIVLQNNENGKNKPSI